MRNYVLLGIAILCGIMAFVITRRSISEMYAEFNRKSKTVFVLTAKNYLPKGQPLREEDLSITRRLQQGLTGEEIVISKETKDEVYATWLGKVLAYDVPEGHLIRKSDFTITVGRQSFSQMIPYKADKTAMRALSIDVDMTSSVSGLIGPNDNVDILSTFRFPDDKGNAGLDTITMTVLQNVKVLAVGHHYLGNRNRPQGRQGSNYRTVTLAVTPKEAELLVFSSRKGELTLTLRNPKDPYTEKNIQDVNFEFLKGKVKDKEYQKERDQFLKPDFRKGL